MPLDNGSPGVLQDLLEVFEAWLVSLLLVPAQLDLANGITATNEIIVTNLWVQGNDILHVAAVNFWLWSHRDVQVDPFHVHLVDDEDKGLVPVRVQVAGLYCSLLLLSYALALL